MLREKHRQDRIEAQGPKVIRAVWRHVERGEVPLMVRYWLDRVRRD